MAIEKWRWVQKQDMGPSPRYAFSMAYNSGSKRVILFGGGVPDGEIKNDTWEWVDQLWIQVADTGPSIGGHDMAYDSERAKMVLFGGTDGVSYKNDTWEWDGNEWTQVADTGPSNRAFHSMTYDSSKKEMLLFGGSDFSAVPIGDTWKMKHNVWAKAQDMGPGPLTLANTIYTGKRAVLFGGFNGTVTNQYTWDWKDTLWAQRENMGLPARAWHSMAYDSDRNRVVLFGGVNEANTFFGDTWELTIKEE